MKPGLREYIRAIRGSAFFFFVGIALLEYLFYFRSNGHFFQGDSIYYFYLRHHTFGEFLRSFFTLDPAGWYRPLTARTIQSLLHPWFGLAPPAYRVAHYVLFMGAIFATYNLASVMTKSSLTACIATVFFGVHTVNAWTTYDVLFTPEIVFTFFYVCSTAAYLRYRQSENRRFFWISVGFFAAGLLSKETALTLPVMLVALDVLVNRTRITSALAAARVHLAILAVYLFLVVGYLGVQRPAFQSILKRPGPEISYRFALDRTIAHNVDYALTWAFNIPRGWQTETRQLHGWTITFLKLFRLAIIVSAVWMMFQLERRLVIAGFLWFFIAVGPALPLFEHFLPYYLFMPLVGFSVAIGVIGDAVYRRLSTYNPDVASAAIALPLIVLAGICAVAVRHDARDNRVLGGSSRLAQNSMIDLKRAHPTLEPNTTIYISDAEEDLAWDTAQGALFKMAYNDDTLRTLYWGWGEVITKGVVEHGPIVVMKYSRLHLTDVTKEFLAASEPPVSYYPPKEHQLQLAPDAVAAGQKYSLLITGLNNSDVVLHYTLNGSPVRAFATHLDDHGQASFDVSPTTEKGVYKFVGFKASGDNDWFQAASAIRIQ